MLGTYGGNIGMETKALNCRGGIRTETTVEVHQTAIGITLFQDIILTCRIIYLFIYLFITKYMIYYFNLIA